MSKPVILLDCEVYKNYFLIAFRNIGTGSEMYIELFGEDAKLTDQQQTKIRSILKSNRTCGFNTRHYDHPIIMLALTGANAKKLKECSDLIINGGMKWWHLEKKYKYRVPQDLDHVDLIDVAPGTASLKIYGGRLHTRTMQDLPLPPDALIRDDQRQMMRDYCFNDLNATLDLLNSLKEQLALREKLSAEYGIDLMSKSDAQIAEAVIRQEVEKLRGIPVMKPGSRAGDKFKYRVPGWVEFADEDLKYMLEMVRDTWFVVDEKDTVLLPDKLATERITIGKGVYRMGIGGLHSSEECVAHKSGDGFHLIDLDVTSYYPSVILNQGLYPDQMGEEFLHVYKGIVERRIAAKNAGDKTVADSLKITINGSFGKLGSKWSYLYSPELMVQVTITGQLALLMLIEKMEAYDIPVVSGNTDGIITYPHTQDEDNFGSVMRWWQAETGFNLEATHYDAVYSRDVNNYLAIKPDGTHKGKGVFAPPGLQKNPSNTICTKAVVEYLKYGVLVEDTIAECNDIREFVTIRQVKGGAIDHWGRYLGKAVRWYYCKPDADDMMGTSKLMYKENENLVARSEGCRPLMTLPDSLPRDLDYEWYIRESYSMLEGMGVKTAISQGVTK